MFGRKNAMGCACIHHRSQVSENRSTRRSADKKVFGQDAQGRSNSPRQKSSCESVQRNNINIRCGKWNTTPAALIDTNSGIQVSLTPRTPQETLCPNSPKEKFLRRSKRMLRTSRLCQVCVQSSSWLPHLGQQTQIRQSFEC